MNNWRLPNKAELNLMHELHKKDIGDFTDDVYWSSSEDDAGYAWLQDFGNGIQYDSGEKYYSLRVRAVRAFESDKKYQIGDKTETGIIFYKNGVNYKECKLKDEGVCSWYDAMKLFKSLKECSFIYRHFEDDIPGHLQRVGDAGYIFTASDGSGFEMWGPSLDNLYIKNH